MTRVELRIAGSVERYDADGRLLESLPLQPMTLSAMASNALVDSIAALTGQLTAAAWPPTTDEGAPDGG